MSKHRTTAAVYDFATAVHSIPDVPALQDAFRQMLNDPDAQIVVIDLAGGTIRVQKPRAWTGPDIAAVENVIAVLEGAQAS